MTIEQALEKAIQGGYLAEDIQGRKAKVKLTSDLFIIQAGNFEMTVPEAMFFLDPSFWQSLGKALGWSDTPKKDLSGHFNPEWLYQAHRFTDHVIGEGRSVESFFEQF